MNPSMARFFDIPEVADAVGPHLAKSDVVALVRTCQQFRTLFEPWLYRDLSLCSSSEGHYHLFAKNGALFRSVRSVRALSRNSHHVRRLYCWSEEFVYLFNCVRRHQTRITTSNIINSSGNSNNSTAFAVDQSASTTSPTFPSWVPLTSASPPRCRLTALAPMNNLVRLQINLRPIIYKHEPRYHMWTNWMTTTTTARQVCWIIQQSPHITHLQLKELSAPSLKVMELLAVTFHGLRLLQEIRLHIHADEEVWQRGFYKVFFALPASVRVCMMVGGKPLNRSHYWRGINRWDYNLREDGVDSELDTEDDDESISNSRQNTNDIGGSIVAVQEDNQDNEEMDQEFVIPEIFCRDEPLSQLKTFQAWNMNLLTNEEVLAVFDHCPRMTRLSVPPVSAKGEDLDILARSISERCPHLRRLSSSHSDATLVRAIMEAMSNQQQIEEVKVSNDHGHFGMGDMRRALARHSTTLRTLDFRGIFFKSENLLSILELCESLEILIQESKSDGSGPFITLTDAISVPWACKRIRHLEIAIGLEPVSLSSEDVPYYQRPAPLTLLEGEKRQFEDLEMFYREIGSLVHLRYLDLHGTYMDHEGNGTQPLQKHSGDFTFPGMLTIRDDVTGRPGYLDLLSGLVKLKTLRGSVRVTTDEAKATVGDREMEWIVSHWPDLERVAFFSCDEDVMAQFSRLRDALRPGLSLSQS
ncbi:MAG: hypothetical protein J3R72DRAFT_444942 [Linnemannia gamsii]|nr:MAG: hypothetical protein J3R72DRAFT_444942 [Linnemannia gamsii]